jgi:hypothetical protein
LSHSGETVERQLKENRQLALARMPMGAIKRIVASKITTNILNGATRAHAAGESFATFTGLRSFRGRGKEEVSHAAACSSVHPNVVRLLTGDDDFYSCHTTPWW